MIVSMNASQPLGCADRTAFGPCVCGIAPEAGIAIFFSTIIASGGQSVGWWSRSRPPLTRQLAPLVGSPPDGI
jgi:hypothetical protein